MQVNAVVDHVHGLGPPRIGTEDVDPLEEFLASFLEDCAAAA